MTSVTRELSSLPVIFAIWLPRLNTLSTILPMALWFVAFFVISLRAFAISVFSFLAVPEAFAAFPAPFSVTDLSRAALPSGDSASASSGASEPTDEDGGDELLPAAVEVILETGMASVSMLQRRLKLGYARAARIVDEMEERGIVGPFEGSKPRQLLITKEQWAAMQGGAPAPAADPAPVEE